MSFYSALDMMWHHIVWITHLNIYEPNKCRIVGFSLQQILRKSLETHSRNNLCILYKRFHGCYGVDLLLLECACLSAKLVKSIEFKTIYMFRVKLWWHMIGQNIFHINSNQQNCDIKSSFVFVYNSNSVSAAIWPSTKECVSFTLTWVLFIKKNDMV